MAEGGAGEVFEAIYVTKGLRGSGRGMEVVEEGVSTSANGEGRGLRE